MNLDRVSASSPLIPRRQALADGYESGSIYRMQRRGELVRLRHGTYVEGGSLVGLPAEDHHRLLIRASLPQVADDAVVSHISAAVLHGLALWALPLNMVHLTRPGRSGGHRRGVLHTRLAPLERNEIAQIEGIAVTSCARTVLDISRAYGFEQAVVCADSALYQGLVRPAELRDALERARGRPGAAGARRVVVFADGRSESPGESRSRVMMRRAGLPPPELQVEIRDAQGLSLGRVDFEYAEFRTVGEFDGRVKYGRLLSPGQSPGDAVFAEKVREDRIRDVPREVVRWTWSEIDHPVAVIGRFERAFKRGARHGRAGG